MYYKGKTKLKTLMFSNRFYILFFASGIIKAKKRNQINKFTKLFWFYFSAKKQKKQKQNPNNLKIFYLRHDPML